jgi:hypothetical protein
MGTDICWEIARFKPAWQQELARSSRGAHQAKDMGDMVWEAEFESYPLRTAEVEPTYVDFLSLQGSALTFYIAPMRRREPTAQAGVLNNGTIQFISDDRTRVTIHGFSRAGALTSGDWFNVNYSDGARDLHRVVDGGSVNDAGEADKVTITPPMRVRASVGDRVHFRSPEMEAVLKPGTLDFVPQSRWRHRLRFEAVQVLR